MRIGIGLPTAVPGTSGRALLAWAQRAESSGFSSLAVIDRVVYDNYEPLVTLAAAASVTDRIELVTNVLIAPQHRTALLAKQAASIDRISDGRLTLGMGVGARTDDFAACDVEIHERGRRFDDQLAEMHAIWSGRTGIGPAPVRRGGPAVLVGGDPRLAAPRVARYGVGWTMMVGTPDQFAAGVGVVREAWQAAGRAGEPRFMALLYAALGPDAAGLAASAVGSYYAWLGPELVGWVTSTVATDETGVAEQIGAFAEAGATDVAVLPCADDLDQLDRLTDATLSSTLAGSLAGALSKEPQ